MSGDFGGDLPVIISVASQFIRLNTGWKFIKYSLYATASTASVRSCAST